MIFRQMNETSRKNILIEITQTRKINMVYTHLYLNISHKTNDNQPIIHRLREFRYRQRRYQGKKDIPGKEE